MQKMDEKYVDSNVKNPHESGNYVDFFYSPRLETGNKVVSQSEPWDLFLQQSYIQAGGECCTSLGDRLLIGMIGK